MTENNNKKNLRFLGFLELYVHCSEHCQRSNIECKSQDISNKTCEIREKMFNFLIKRQNIKIITQRNIHSV